MKKLLSPLLQRSLVLSLSNPPPLDRRTRPRGDFVSKVRQSRPGASLTCGTRRAVYRHACEKRQAQKIARVRCIAPSALAKQKASSCRRSGFEEVMAARSSTSIATLVMKS